MINKRGKKMNIVKEDMNESMRELRPGSGSFRELRENDSFYVDKTAFIDHVLNNRGCKALLFTRPRRFGKTLNLSTLNCYLNKDYAGNDWFDDLNISKLRPNDPEKNSHVILNLSFIRSFDGSFQDFRIVLKDVLRKAYIAHDYLLNSDKLPEYRKTMVSKILSNNDTDFASSMCDLIDMLHVHHGRPIVLLIDEYDNPANRSKGEERRKILNSLSGFYTLALKDNENVEFAVVTGVMRIAKESIFSGLNNLHVNDIFSKDSDELFGFTNAEIKTICEEFEKPEKVDEIRSWYDGYRFGGVDVYNPWSVVNYIQSGFNVRPYWINTSSNLIINEMLEDPDKTMIDTLNALASGRPIMKTLHTTVTYSELDQNRSKIYSILVMAGYLNAVPNNETDDLFELTIPNKEVLMEFSRKIMEKVDPSSTMESKVFVDAVMEGNVDVMISSLEKLAMNSISIRLSQDHRTYQMFIAGLMMQFEGRYEITADFESGRGYHDLKMKRIKGTGPNIIMEFKETESGSQESLAKEALKQIHDRRYYHGMTGDTLLYGICIKEKTPLILSENLTLP